MLKSWNESPVQTLFATTPPGLEDLGLGEITSTGLFEGSEAKHIVKHHGGIEFQLARGEVPGLIRRLKIPTHLLWRLGSFRVRDFPKLFAKTKAMPWALVLAKSDIALKVSATRSRLIHTKRLEQTIRSAIETSLKARSPKKEWLERWSAFTESALPTLYARLDNDVLTFSLDLAGENLHRRGLRAHIGAAPLRENLAAACLLSVLGKLETQGIRGQELTLWDPFCGSGTFLLEAMSLRSFNETREFALDLYHPLEEPLLSEGGAFANYQGSDISQKMTKIALHNGQALKVKSALHLEVAPVKLASPPKDPFVIITNPPYGERLKDVSGLVDFYERLKGLEQCRGAFVLIPHHLVPEKFKAPALLKFSHGGISVGLYQIV